MMLRSLRPSRSTLICLSRQQGVQARTFIKPTAVRRADIVQEMYIRELKSYKPTPIKESDSQGHVQIFKAPKAPKSPEESNIANELKAYEDQTVEVEGQVAAGEANATEDDWFEDDMEEDEHNPPKASH